MLESRNGYFEFNKMQRDRKKTTLGEPEVRMSKVSTRSVMRGSEFPRDAVLPSHIILPSQTRCAAYVNAGLEGVNGANESDDMHCDKHCTRLGRGGTLTSCAITSPKKCQSTVYIPGCSPRCRLCRLTDTHPSPITQWLSPVQTSARSVHTDLVPFYPH